MADEQDKNAEENGQQPPKKSKTLLFIIIGVALIIFGGGGYFAYKQFLAPAPSVENGGPAAAGDGKSTFGYMFPVGTFTVNLADPKGKRYIRVKLEAEFESEAALEKAQKLAPKLKDTVIMLLSSLSFEEVMTPEGKIRIRDELIERFNQVMRPDKVKNIYFTDFLVQ